MTDAPQPTELDRNPSSTLQTCYVSASALSDLQSLLQLLKSRTIAVATIDSAEGVYPSSLHKAFHLINQADFFIGAPQSFNHADQANVFLETGYAYALKKPILLIVPPESEPLPSDITTLYTVRADLHDADAIGFALDQLLSSPPELFYNFAVPSRRSHPLKADATAFLTRLDKLLRQSSKSGLALAALVVEVLQAAGVSNIIQGEPDVGADLVIWDDELQSITSNPVVIEIKTSLSGPPVASAAVNQLSSYLFQGRGRFGILLYGSGPNVEALRIVRHPFIVVLSIRELIEQLRDHSLLRVITDNRNRLLHGVIRG